LKLVFREIEGILNSMRIVKFVAIEKASEWKWQGRETRGGRSFDNLGHAASRSGTNGIITVMLLKLRFFDPGAALRRRRAAPRRAAPLPSRFRP